MPELGGKALAGSLGTMMASVRKSMEESRQRITDAATELNKTVEDGGKAVERAIRAETAAVRQSYAEILGNALDGENDESV